MNIARLIVLSCNVLFPVVHAFPGFTPLYYVSGRPQLEYAVVARSVNLIADAFCLRTNPAVGGEARKGFSPPAIQRKTTTPLSRTSC